MRTRLSVVLIAACALAVGLSACTTPEGGAPPEGAGIAAVTMADVKNLTYNIDGTDYALVDGAYSQPAAPGSATMNTVVIFDEGVVFGNLNDDAIGDAAVVLYNDPGGSGTFRYLAAVLASNAGPTNEDTVLLGDRVRIESLGLQNGEVTMEVVTHGPDDPMCCPTERRKWAYTLEGGKWVQTVDDLVGSVGEDPGTTAPTVTVSVKPEKAVTGDKVDIYTHAFDSPGITKLELWQNGEQTDQEWASPDPQGVGYLHYTFVYRDAKEGNHEFRVKALDVDGNEGWSETKIVKVRDSWDDPEADQSTPEQP